MKRYPNNGYNSFEVIGDSIVVLGTLAEMDRDVQEQRDELVTQKLVTLYESKIDKVTSVSAEYKIYSLIIADLRLFGVKYTTATAAARIESGYETKKVSRLYTRFLAHCTQVTQAI